jgi:hypothetical protein
MVKFTAIKLVEREEIAFDPVIDLATARTTTGAFA